MAESLLKMSKTRLNSYRKKPTNYVNITFVEELCASRMKLYQVLEDYKEKVKKVSQKEKDDFIITELEKKKLDIYLKIFKNEYTDDDKHTDLIAHSVLSLCYCKWEETREQFVRNELEWFEILYSVSDRLEIIEFAKENDWYPPLKKLKDLPNRSDIIESFPETFDACFVMPWTKFAPELIGQRRVALKNGIAYLPEFLLITQLKYKLKREWLENLKLYSTKVDLLPVNLLEHIIKRFSSVIQSSLCYNNNPLDINLNNIDDNATRHYPLCMRYLHDKLRELHHLKYGGRMQLGIFLKNTGLPYEDAQLFWRQEFTKKIPEQKYNSKYQYLFKHQYGKVGSRINYKPWSCDEVISSMPGYNQYHGCPFKNWDRRAVGDFLKNKEGLEECYIRDIEDLVVDDDPKGACLKHFCAKNSVMSKSSYFVTPNDYFRASKEFEDSHP